MATVTPDKCPNPEIHGNPFRYCNNCTWTEPQNVNPDIENRFAFHQATSEEKKMAHGSVRAACFELAKKFDESLPGGREKATALTKLEEAMFWANAAIARNNK